MSSFTQLDGGLPAIHMDQRLSLDRSALEAANNLDPRHRDLHCAVLGKGFADSHRLHPPFARNSRRHIGTLVAQ